MKENYNNGVLFYTFPEWENYDCLMHAFSSREGGVSIGDYSYMNLGIKTEDKREKILVNYERFCGAVGVKKEEVVLANLNHEANIKNVTLKDEGEGLLKPFEEESIDGLLCNEIGPVLTATFADCVPVYFFDPIKRVVGIAHSGWRGTLAQISGKMVERMRSDYGCDPTDILAGIGPSICRCCYEVDQDVSENFFKLPFLPDSGWFYWKEENGKVELDLWRVILENLLYAGIELDNISISGLCTCCNKYTFFSHRATKGKRGAMAGMISLRK